MKNKPQQKKKTFNLSFIAMLCIFLFLLFLSVFGSSGIIKVLQMNRKIDLLNQEIVFMEKENKRMLDQIHRLKEDAFSIEKLAREELGLVKPGERVYEFIDENREKPKEETPK